MNLNDSEPKMGKDKVALAICFCLIVTLAGFSTWLYVGAKGLESKVSDLESRTSNLETENAELNEKVQNLNFTFMAIEEIKITNIQFGGGGAYIAVTVNNTGISAVTISEAWVNSVVVTTTSPLLPKSISANTGIVLNMTSTWVDGNNYQVKLLSSKGNQFLYNAVAPSS